MWEPPWFLGLGFIVLTPIYVILSILSLNPIIWLITAVVLVFAFISIKDLFHKE